MYLKTFIKHTFGGPGIPMFFTLEHHLPVQFLKDSWGLGRKTEPKTKRRLGALANLETRREKNGTKKQKKTVLPGEHRWFFLRFFFYERLLSDFQNHQEPFFQNPGSTQHTWGPRRPRVAAPTLPAAAGEGDRYYNLEPVWPLFWQ